MIDTRDFWRNGWARKARTFLRKDGPGWPRILSRWKRAIARCAIDFSLPVLSIRQPWAHAIVAGLKDVENRTWRTRYRGAVLIHAGSARLNEELRSYQELKVGRGIEAKTGGRWGELEFGGIVGMADIVDCVPASAAATATAAPSSPWFVGPWGFVLRNARPLPFFPCKGKLGFFKVGGRN